MFSAHRTRESQPRVFATRRLPGDAFARLAARTDLDVWNGPGAPSPSQLAARAGDAEGILCLLTDAVDAELIAACPRLRVISSCSVGVDHIDVGAARDRGIAVGNTPGVLVETTADLAFALLLATARRVPEADRFVRAGEWTWVRRWEPELLLGRDVWGAELGLIGLGAIGRAVARRASGFGMRVRAWNRSARPDLPDVTRCELGELLAESDFVSVHVSLTEQTRGLIGRREIARMRRGAVLINTARGGIVDETALVEALHSGQLGAAGLDVFDHEPLPMDSALLAAPNLVVLPHIGSASFATRARMAELAVDNLIAGLAGLPLPNPVV